MYTMEYNFTVEIMKFKGKWMVQETIDPWKTNVTCSLLFMAISLVPLDICVSFGIPTEFR